MLRLAFLPERFAKAAQERSVKRTRRAGSRWETHRLNRIVDAKVIGLIRLLAQAVRAVADHDGGNPQPFNAFEMPKIHTRAHLNFFLQRHPFHQFLHVHRFHHAPLKQNPLPRRYIPAPCYLGLLYMIPDDLDRYFIKFPKGAPTTRHSAPNPMRCGGFSAAKASFKSSSMKQKLKTGSQPAKPILHSPSVLQASSRLQGQFPYCAHCAFDPRYRIGQKHAAHPLGKPSWCHW